MTQREMPDGSVKELSLPVEQLKPRGPQLMSVARARGDVAEYSNVSVEPEARGWGIQAHRYSKLRCYTDENYALVVSKGEGGEFEIVEERMKSRVLSSCPDKPLGPLIDAIVQPLSGKLPLQVDANTRLDAVAAVDDGVVYSYMVDLGGEAVDEAAFAAEMKKLLIPQTCMPPQQRSILDSGGSVRYVYKNADGSPLADVNFTEMDCM